MTWPKYKGLTVGAAKVMSEDPLTDGSTALEIINFRLDERGLLDSTFRIMPLMDNDSFYELSGTTYGGLNYINGKDGKVIGLFTCKVGGSVPELLILSTAGVFRFQPWNSNTTSTTDNIYDQQYYYRSDNTKETVVPQGLIAYPPQFERVGDRIYFTFCDGGGAWVWDQTRLRSFGYRNAPSATDAEGPSRSGTSPNAAGFSKAGRIGTIEPNWTLSTNDITADPIEDLPLTIVGGIDSGKWAYHVVFEGPDGAYSSTSPRGDQPTMRMDVETDIEDPRPDRLRRRFRLYNIPVGPVGTKARIILRTMNLERLPSTDEGLPRFLHRIPNNQTLEYIDDIPDEELGSVWINRDVVPSGFYFMKSFSGSMFMMRTDGNPSRIWWSEQENLSGPTPESMMEGHWREVFPATGPITAAITTRLAYAEQSSALLIFKEGSTHFLSGEYPNWHIGTLHSNAGCAGPSLVQAVPDGSVIWYGAKTFWRMDTDGKVSDIGTPIQKRLSRVNPTYAHMGISFVDYRVGEAVFVLPVDDQTEPNMQFIFDYRVQGWRLREDLKFNCAAVTPSSGVVIAGGTYDTRPNIYVYGRGYPGYYAPNPTASYTTGWRSFGGLGPELHASHRASDLIFLMEERCEASATVTTYQDWDADVAINTESITLAHPENSDIAYYAVTTTPAAYDVGVYRARRPYSNRIAIDVPSHEVFSVKLESSDPMALYTIDAFGPQTSLPGSRTPSS